MAQKDTNPYPHSDSNKRYMTYDWYMKARFGGKTAKVPLEIGCTCPNADGTKGCGGCIYCQSGSRSAIGETMDEQYASGVAIVSRKWKPIGFIPYLQSHTNTYGDPHTLHEFYKRAADMDGAVMLNIATRADCLSDEIIDILCSVSEEIPLTIELGLQTSNDRTADLINRCHTFADFLNGYGRLRAAADEVNRKFGCENFLQKRMMIGIHIINGLPGEGKAEMHRTAADIAQLKPELIKIHLMHVLRGTTLADMYESGAYSPMEREDYVRITCDQLEMMPPETVIGRVTGDGMADELLAPQWSRRKTEVANEIDKELYRRGTYQGCHR